ncbi:MFS transporter [uncultured Agrococcus sp.]|uniref:MFS transporter n=1 Tax=uncultured Agrococcus sp. TaxID=382258 RepID=UPI0026004EBF|nr:MFS transporter [uncultured Agrococcus sp.]
MTTTPTTEARTKQKPRRILIGTGFGNALEWFDWQIYATFAPFIAAVMFSTQDPLSALLSTLAIFAVGFVARPLGGLLFGWIGDRMGRKFSLVLAIILASVGSLMIGLLPTFDSIGSFASLLLLVARLIQGLAHGGEMPAVQTYLSEAAPKERRGLWSSFIYVSGTTGILSATLLGALLTTFLSPEFMADWGWRIPFLLAAVLGLYALVMRAKLEETESFEHEKAETATEKVKESLWRQLGRNWRPLMAVIGLTVGITVSFYVWGVTAPTYASGVLGMDQSTALWSGVVGTAIFILVLPFWGWLSDRIGRKPVFIIGVLGVAAGFFPVTAFMSDQPWTLVVAMSIQLFFMAGAMSIAPAMYAELLPTGIRTIGTALPYAFAVAIFGGTAPYLQTWMTSFSSPLLFSGYAVALLVISAITALIIPETRGIDLKQRR